jgi:hypothetical protein
VSADQPLTGDELATIKARAEATTREYTRRRQNHEWSATTLRLVAEVERLRAQMSHPADDPECVASPCQYHEVLAERDALQAQVER